MLKWAWYRKYVIFELYDTEVSYVNDIKIIIEQVYYPTRFDFSQYLSIRKEEFLTENEQRKLFLNIEAIYLLNGKFKQEL